MAPRALSTTLLILSTSAFLFGCPPEDPPETQQPPPEPRAVTPQELLEDANRNLRAHLVGAEATVAGIDLEALLSELVPPTGEAPCPDGEPCDDPQPEDTIDAEEMAAMMAEQVFVITNLEASTETSLTLRLDAAMCPPDDSGAADAECLAEVGELQPRLHLTSLRAGDVDVALQTGATRQTLGRLELYAQHLAAQVDLAAVKAAVQTALSTLEDAPPEVLAAIEAATVRGQVRLQIAPSNGHYGATVALPSGLALSTTVEGMPVSLDVPPANPAVVISRHATANQLNVQVSMGASRLSAPAGLLAGSSVVCTTGPDGETICEEAPSDIEGQLEVRTPAVDATLTLSEQALRLESRAAASPFSVRLDNRTLAELEVGAVSGHLMNVEVTSGASDLAIRTWPSARMILELDLAPVADFIEAPAWLVNERLEVKLDGAAEQTLAVSDEDGQLRVVQGKLTIDSRAANRQIVVDAGECLVPISEEEPPEDTHPLELVEGGACR